MRRRMLAVVALVCAGISTVSCSAGSPGRVEGDASPTSLARQPYPAFLDSEARAAVAYRDTLRPLDPCGFLDEGAVRAIAAPDYFGADGGFDQCSVKFRNPVGAKSIVGVGVAMGPGGPATYGTPVPVGGTTVRVHDSGDFCTAYLRFDDRVTLRFSVTTKGDFLGRAPRVDLCPEAASLAAAAIPHLAERPLRSESTRAHMNTKLARLDPCAVVDVIARDHPHPWVNPLPTPWSCNLQLDYGVDSTSRHIDFAYVSDASLTRSPGSNEIASRIMDLPSLEEPGSRGTPWSDTCQLHVGTDPTWTPTKGTHTRKTEVISVSTPAGGCDAARAVATEVVRLYKQLPN
ncbi:hypothetical protein [Nocardia wallacei]|uniref:hypothetical protein n=1 Tax=Nocardia wallacei TaxID=480035 RepID=UPI00245741F9|nr:hypothetical protein [Nocardia wallacei]